MFRMIPIEDAASAADYFGRTDGGYYLDSELKRQWGGRDADRLGLTGAPTLKQFKRLLDGRDPHTGKQLTAKLIEDRVPGWAFTASVPKGCSTAIEGGDSRLRDALWECGVEAMADVERHAMTRVRKGGVDEDRVVGSFPWLGVEHDDTRPAKADGMPDWDRHLHFIVPNLCFDPVEHEWKALKVREIFDLKRVFDRSFDLRMAARAAALGYEIETKYQPDGRGGMRYYTWDIKAAPGHEAGWQSTNDKNSRRSKEVAEEEKTIVAARKEAARLAGDPDWELLPDRLPQLERDKLGATSRQAKRKNVTREQRQAYWQERLTPEEREAITATVARAMGQDNPSPEKLAAKGMAYAIAHLFQRRPEVEWRELQVAAMERCMGGALPEEFLPEALRQGVLFQGGKVTTRKVWEQEQRITGFARAGKGIFAPLAPGQEDGLEGLSGQQAAAVRHVWSSTDQVVLIRGGAGTGKTTMMTPALSKLGVRVELMAPSADASRGQLRKEGFKDANTVAAFLGDRKRQEALRPGDVIWVDEAPLLPIDELEQLCAVVAARKLRLVYQGDPRQHTAVDRYGNMMDVLEEYAGLPVARLTEIQRQKGAYAELVAAVRDHEWEKADGMARDLGWIVEGNGHDGLVAEYARAIEEKKPDGSAKTVLVVDPTHKDGAALTKKLRTLRKAKGLIKGEEKTFPQLVPLNWTEAQKADAVQYAGGELVAQFFRNCGPFKAGERVKGCDLVAHLPEVDPKYFAVYRPAEVAFAVGDDVRFTGNGWDVTGKHRIDNGRLDRIKAFTAEGNPVLSNGWVIGKDFAHVKHGLVQTSHATQSKTDDIVLAAMNRNALGAMGAEQAYVTISRGRERGMIFTDLPREELLKAVSRADDRRSATELLATPAAPETHGMWQFMEKMRSITRQLQRKAAEVFKLPARQKELSYGRG